MKELNEITIAVAGTGYVGLSIATLLSQHHRVLAVDVIPEKVEKINNRISPIQDDYIEKYLKGVASVPTIDRMRVLRLIENITMGTAAVGYLPESMHGAGSPQAQRIMIARQANMEQKKALAKAIARID